LKQIGLGLLAYHDANKHFPTGTLANSDLPPEKRFSWIIQIYPTYLQAGPMMRFDKSKAWDDGANCPPRWQLWDNSHGLQNEVRVGIDAFCLTCPDNPARSVPSLPTLTHYVGIAGVGENAAVLLLVDPKAGFFGYDRKVTTKDMKHGPETTIALIEALDGGPWTAGGRATIRGLTPEIHSFGIAGQFASNHSAGTNVLFGDASVRVMTSVSPQVLEAMAVLAGDRNGWVDE
jgi:hypothetical protein